MRSPKYKYAGRFEHHQRVNVATADSVKENRRREKVKEVICDRRAQS